MKNRMISLLLALILVIGLLALPASAATAKEVHSYLVSIAKQGTYDSEGHWWHDDMPLDEEGSLYFGVYYLEQTQYIELSVYSSNYEITWRISGNPSPAYNAFMRVYDAQNSTGTVSIGANYSGAAYSAFNSFTYGQKNHDSD